MPTTKESVLRSNIIKALKGYSGWWFVTHGEGFQESGIPDIIGCYAGRFFGLEVKLPGKLHTLTARQSRVLDLIRRAGGRGAVITSVQEAMDFVFGENPL